MLVARAGLVPRVTWMRAPLEVALRSPPKEIPAGDGVDEQLVQIQRAWRVTGQGCRPPAARIARLVPGGWFNLRATLATQAGARQA